MSAQLAGVKVGDTIKSGRQYERNSYDLFRVERLTSTQAICKALGAATEYEAKFNIESGLLIGSAGSGGWHRRHGSIATEADFAAIAMRNRIRRAQEVIARLVVTESNVDAVEALLKASKP